MDIKIAAAPIKVTAGRPDLNIVTVLAAIERARSEHIDILLLPQHCLYGANCGYIYKYLDYKMAYAKYIQQILQAAPEIVVVFAEYEFWNLENPYNANARYTDIVGLVAAQGAFQTFGCGEPYVSQEALYSDLDDDDESDEDKEQRLKETKDRTCKVTIKGTEFSLLVMTEDDDFTPAPFPAGTKGIVCYLESAPYECDTGLPLYSDLANKAALPLVSCNLLGVDNTGKTIYTYSGMCGTYTYHGANITLTKPFSGDWLIANYDSLLVELPTLDFDEEEDEEPEIAPVYRALRLAASEFLQQMGIHRMTIGLSGGIDSAVAAALYVDILGPENVLLVNMPSSFNSEITQYLARLTAEALGAKFTAIPITESVKHTYKQLTTTPIYDYQTDKQEYCKLSPLVMENIQARDRGSRIIAGLAAAFGGAFSCNGNKTELTVGYCTFYGDMAGALAILGDLWKYQVYALGHYLNDYVYHQEVIPEEIFKIRPSAELSSEQTVGNGGDPLYYDYHDYLFRYIVDCGTNVSLRYILMVYLINELDDMIGCSKDLTKDLFPQASEFTADLERWWKLYKGMGVAKRLQAPPLIAVSSVPLTAQSHCQMSTQLPPDYLALKNSIVKGVSTHE